MLIGVNLVKCESCNCEIIFNVIFYCFSVSVNFEPKQILQYRNTCLLVNKESVMDQLKEERAFSKKFKSREKELKETENSYSNKTNIIKGKNNKKLQKTPELVMQKSHFILCGLKLKTIVTIKKKNCAIRRPLILKLILDLI